MKACKMLLIALLCLGAALLSACSSQTLSAAEKKDDPILIRFGHGAAETNARHTAVQKFKEIVEEKSGGRIKVEIFPAEQLGTEAQMVESVSFNDLQMVAAATFAQYDKRIGIFELPFLFDSYEEAWEVMDGPIGKQIAEPFTDHNLHIIAYFENGFRHITSNKLIETPDDIEGLKIRTPEAPISISTFKAMGASPTPMAFGELYMALQQGTVDAQENPIANIHAAKFQDVQNHLSLTAHQYTPLPVAISEEFWQSLSPELQEIVQASAQEAAQFHRNLTKENDVKLVEDLKAMGMKVNEPEKAPFKDKAQKVYAEYEKLFGKEIITEIVKAAE